MILKSTPESPPIIIPKGSPKKEISRQDSLPADFLYDHKIYHQNKPFYTNNASALPPFSSTAATATLSPSLSAISNVKGILFSI